MPPALHPDALHFADPAASLWEDTAPALSFTPQPLDGDERCDIAIVGGGFTGLSCALRLARGHGADVRLLEAATPGWGASGRNGGFACIGAAKLSWPDMARRYGMEATRAFFDIQREAIESLRATAAELGIEADIAGTGEITLAHRPPFRRALAQEQETLRTLFGHETELLEPEALAERGMAAPFIHGGLWNPTGFGLHPLKLARGLADAAHAHGARLHGQSRVTGWAQAGGRHRLTTAAGGTLTADRVILACNGYTPEATFPPLAGRLMPALSNILVTRPLSLSEREAQGWTTTTMAFDARALLHYVRLLPDGRFLFGGRGGTDMSDGAAPAMEASMRREFEAMFPAWRHVEHTHFWRGLVCLARDLVPHIGPLDERSTVWTAIAYHGNGVAMANWSGRHLADIVAGQTALADLPAVMTAPLRRFPFAGLRQLYMKAAYAAFTVRDEWL
ncbi:FAD-binding oxidoreductase [Kaustia mangrovi]|uniref:FAD-binding oxidoreductase n=1 Tax=Kaustia mangrovi TaxID=2593653 RepID=A0A7S8C488_9HYPH|nr:FAD-dependent oxidoreductase [Kaustia mangrovi]QPC43071.1 FAD-binding oxidoreductase [Kaustia mangrovi]